MKIPLRSVRFFSFLIAGLALGCAAPGAKAAVTAPASVEQWGVFEIQLSGPKDGNPFVDVSLAGDFSDGSRTFHVAGFYDGAGVYRIRFMPDKPGRWTYVTHSNRWPLTGKSGEFAVTPATGNDHGPVRVHDTYHFAYADGTPYSPFGTTCYSWTQRNDALEEETLRTLAASPFNKIRMCVFPQDFGASAKDQPLYFPYAGTPPKDWDYTRFNPAFFQHLEKRIGQLRDLGIQADLILFHPYGKTWGFSSMDRAAGDRYLSYLIARLAAYRNVWWSMANEYDFIKTKNEADWDHIFQVVQRSDPYDHLRSIHNGALIYDNSKPWVTHASIQNGSAVESVGRAELYRDVWRKPVVYDEVKYEGDSSARWGQLTGQEMVERFWNGFVAGAYVGHSECFADAHGIVWLGQGGVLHGQSPARIGFLRQIIEAGPAAGIDPIDRWQDTNMGGQPGEYYLLYFDRATPSAWKFELYKSGLKNGMSFKIDVIDTWNMTITPVPGVFVTKRLDNYHFVDAHGREVPLPGRPYLALRIQRVPGAAPSAGDDAEN